MKNTIKSIIFEDFMKILKKSVNYTTFIDVDKMLKRTKKVKKGVFRGF